MIDIVEITDGEDLGIQDAIVPKAGNLLSIQIGSLEYSQDFGVDLKFFLSTDFQFQNESFKSYLVQRLTQNQINVAQLVDVLETFYEKLTFYVGDANANTGGLIR